MHKRFLSSIGRRSSRFPLKDIWQEPSAAANHQEGQESEKAIPDGDTPEASVSRGVVSLSMRVNRGARYTKVIKETILRVWRTKQSGTTMQPCHNISLADAEKREKKSCIYPSSSRLQSRVQRPHQKPRFAYGSFSPRRIFSEPMYNTMRSCWYAY